MTATAAVNVLLYVDGFWWEVKIGVRGGGGGKAERII